MNSRISIARCIPRAFQSLHHKTHFLPSRTAHSQAKAPKLSKLISPICSLLRNGGKWDALSSSFGSSELDETLVESIILTLKEPVDAKYSLLFFHWASQCKQRQHSLKSYCIVIHILVRANLLTDAQALLESAILKNQDTGSSKNLVAETLLTTYEAADPDPRIFELLLQTYSKMRMVEQAFDACQYLGDQGFTSSLVSFNRMLHVARASGQHDLAWKVYEQMLVRRVYPNQSSVETMVNLMCKEGSLQRMLGLLDRIHGKRCTAGVLVNMAMVLRMFEEDRIEQGLALLRRMLQKNLIFDDVTCSLIISAYCRIGRFEAAMDAYEDMINKGCSANAFVYTCFIGARCKEGRMDEALLLVEEMHSTGLEPYDETYNYLIEGCARAGRLEENLAFCEKMLKDGFVPAFPAFSVMVGKLCDCGKVEKADEILTAVSDRGFVPNEDIYCSLIKGYGSIRKVQKILSLYHEMQHRGLNLGFQTYATLFESLCQCGSLKDAEKFLYVMKCKSLDPTRSMLDALIDGYLKKGDAEGDMNLSNEMMSKMLLSGSERIYGHDVRKEKNSDVEKSKDDRRTSIGFFKKKALSASTKFSHSLRKRSIKKINGSRILCVSIEDVWDIEEL